MMADPDPNGSEYMGAYMADLNTNVAVLMAVVSDP